MTKGVFSRRARSSTRGIEEVLESEEGGTRLGSPGFTEIEMRRLLITIDSDCNVIMVGDRRGVYGVKPVEMRSRAQGVRGEDPNCE
jgi:hypothetical protein